MDLNPLFMRGDEMRGKGFTMMILLVLLYMVVPAEIQAQESRGPRFVRLLRDLVERNPAALYVERAEDLELRATQVVRLETIDVQLAARADELSVTMDAQGTETEGISARRFREALRDLRKELRAATEAVHEVLTEEQLQRARVIRTRPR